MKKVQPHNPLRPFQGNDMSSVDDDIYGLICALTWHMSNKGYAQTASLSSPKKIRQALGISEFEPIYLSLSPIKMHHFVIGQPIKGFVVDHINGDTLDNRRENLRLVTWGKNSSNRARHKTNKAGHQGVYWLKQEKKWRAHITVDRKYHSLGCYKELADAIAARKAADEKYGFISR